MENHNEDIEESDLLFFGIDGLDVQESFVHDDPANRTGSTPRGATCFQWPDLHTDSSLPNPFLSVPYSFSTFNAFRPSLWDEATIFPPPRVGHSYDAGFIDPHLTPHDISGSWNIPSVPSNQFSALNDHEYNFGSDDLDMVSANALHMSAGDSERSLTIPSHLPTGWGELIPATISRTTSTASSVSMMEQLPTIVGEHLISPKDAEVPFCSTEQAVKTSNFPRPVFRYITMDTNTKKMTEGCRPGPKKSKGRTGPLKLEIKVGAAKMRKVKACESCRRRKTQCDDGVACKSCIQFYKCDLVHHSCRGRQLQHLATKLLNIGNVFPSGRSVGEFMAGGYQINPVEHKVNISLGFGEPMVRDIKIVVPANCTHGSFPRDFVHDHIVYPWPTELGQPTQRETRRDYVFPAVLSNTADLKQAVNEHLTTLLDDGNNFEHFPLFNSPFRILRRNIFAHYVAMNESNEKQILRNALKLLILVHIGGDTSVLPTPKSRAIIGHFFGHSINYNDVKACFIRAQLGPIYSELALQLMKDVLKEVEFHCLSRKCQHFPLIISAFAVLFMAVESIQYHSAKEAYHANYNHKIALKNHVVGGPSLEEAEGVDALLKFYKACFAGCHRDTFVSVSQIATASCSNGVAGGMNFVAGLKDAVERVKLYLEEKSRISLPSRGAADMTIFFDRLLARLFLLEG